MSKNILPSSYLKPLLANKGYTINDLKAEVILMLVENFISHYIRSEETGKSKNIFDNVDRTENNCSIDNSHKIDRISRFKKLRNDLLDLDILTIKKLNEILAKASLYLQTTYSPYTILNNTGIDTFTKARKDIFTKEELDIWLPDVLSIYLIIDAKNMGIDFSKFPCIANDDFEDMLEFFMETNSEFRKRDNTINSIRNPSMIHKTSRVSLRIIEKIFNLQ